MFENSDDEEGVGKFLKHAKLLIGICVLVVSASFGVVTWSNSNYELKSEAQSARSVYDEKLKQLQSDLTTLKNDVSQIRGGQSQIQSDVSYIKGRLEPALKLGK